VINEKYILNAITDGPPDVAIESAKIASTLFAGDEEIGDVLAQRISNSDDELRTMRHLLMYIPAFGSYSPKTLGILKKAASSHRDQVGLQAIVALTKQTDGDFAMTDSAFSIMNTDEFFCDPTLLDLIGKELPIADRQYKELQRLDGKLREQSDLAPLDRTVKIYNVELYRTKMDEALSRTKRLL